MEPFERGKHLRHSLRPAYLASVAYANGSARLPLFSAVCIEQLVVIAAAYDGDLAFIHAEDIDYLLPLLIVKSQSRVDIADKRAHHVAQVVAVSHLPEICPVRDPYDLPFREMLSDDGGKKKEVVADDYIGIEVCDCPGYRAGECLFKFRYHGRRKVAVSCRLIRHYVRHPDDRERKGFDQRFFRLARSRKKTGLFFGKKDRITGCLFREVHDVIRKDAADNGLSVAHAVECFDELRHVCAASGRMRLLCCYA